MFNPYIGRDSQLFGVEEHRLTGGRGDGMRIFEVFTSAGLRMTILPDRCLDIARISYKGVNLSYFSAAGYVAPAYFDKNGDGWLNSFTAGFLTTCGLSYFGAPCRDGDEELGLHGVIGNQPAENAAAYVDGDTIVVRGSVYEAKIFGKKLRLDRQILIPVDGKGFSLRDKVTNFGDSESPAMLLYHMNFGYPLLSEDARVEINSAKVLPRNDRAALDLADWQKVLPPQEGYEEECYYHFFDGRAKAGIVNEKLGIRADVGFDVGTLTQLTQWKMMGVRDYVMGLEPGTNDPDGRPKARKDGRLRMLGSGESMETAVDFAADDL